MLKWLLTIGMAVFAVTGCVSHELSKPDESFQKSVSTTPVKIDKPTEALAENFVVPASKTDTGIETPTVSISLPKGCKVGKEDNLFTGPDGSYISVIVEATGEQAAKLYDSRSKKGASAGSQPALAGAWLGQYDERKMPDRDRRERLYAFSTPSMTYTMMTSWPHGNEKAAKEAERMAAAVAWTIQEKK